MLIQQLVHRMRIKYSLSQDGPHTLPSFVGGEGVEEVCLFKNSVHIILQLSSSFCSQRME